MANDKAFDELVAAVHISEKTGLKTSTVIDLLRSGWTYVEELNKMPRWQKDIGRSSGEQQREGDA